VRRRSPSPAETVDDRVVHRPVAPREVADHPFHARGLLALAHHALDPPGQQRRQGQQPMLRGSTTVSSTAPRGNAARSARLIDVDAREGSRALPPPLGLLGRVQRQRRLARACRAALREETG